MKASAENLTHTETYFCQMIQEVVLCHLVYTIWWYVNICMWHGSHQGLSGWANHITDDNWWSSKDSCLVFIVERTITIIGWRSLGRVRKVKESHIKVQALKASEWREKAERQWQWQALVLRPWHVRCLVWLGEDKNPTQSPDPSFSPHNKLQ